jgi:carbamoyltransferase
MRSLLTNRIAKYKWFQTFRCMVLQEDAGKWFNKQVPGGLGHYTVHAKPETAAELPAAIHVDGSANIQTVGPNDDEMNRLLLKTWKNHTGISVLINLPLELAGSTLPERWKQVKKTCESTAGGYVVRAPG